MLAALLISGAVIDVVVAVSMLWFLIRRRGDAMESAVRLIDKLVVYTVRTGLVTSLAAVTIVIVFLLQSQNLIWLALYTLLAKRTLFPNS
ncbi:hypothetical protein FA15DRAFT_362863 [Coprinopsis marcescibilis]|uniref:DUF6534 domain-containing protein n=1 Tax=Coprinopsis marcescibilis TaxID=230819 RepID=A0A5C3KAW1_COPMA|nr:hypothetical protein FA15DRAFT_362863 [Coprinopsis marcescibilis]